MSERHEKDGEPPGNTDLAPNQHGAEDDLEAVEEVVSYDDDRSAPCGPALTGTDGFDARRGSWVENTGRTPLDQSVYSVVTCVR